MPDQNTARKVSKYEYFSGPNFPAFGPEKTPFLDTFYAVKWEPTGYLNMSHLNARSTGYLNMSHLLIYIKGIKNTENKLCESNEKRRKIFNKKWKNVLIN